MIDKFQGEYRFLSNFYPSPIMMFGEEYPTVEHAFQAVKTCVTSQREEIRNALTPGDAKRLGRTVSMRPNWEDTKLEAMKMLAYSKFVTHPLLAEKLRATGTAELIEGNTWGDKFWGVCDGEGENHLGRILMAIREHV